MHFKTTQVLFQALCSSRNIFTTQDRGAAVSHQDQGDAWCVKRPEQHSKEEIWESMLHRQSKYPFGLECSIDPALSCKSTQVDQMRFCMADNGVLYLKLKNNHPYRHCFVEGHQNFTRYEVFLPPILFMVVKINLLCQHKRSFHDFAHTARQPGTLRTRCGVHSASCTCT